MYHLTLSLSDRQAIDWIGDRYAHGTDLYKLLWGNCESHPVCDWDDERDITFYVPEHIAWQINEIGEESLYNWDCFAPYLAAKLTEFCYDLV